MIYTHKEGQNGQKGKKYFMVTDSGSSPTEKMKSL